MAYKKNQGRIARMIAFWSMAILAFYGCTSLYGELVVLFPDSLATPIIDWQIPILGLAFSPALVVATLTLLLAFWLLARWEQKPTNAELLIETENEMRKVSWPTIEEATNGSWTVLMTVAFLMVFLATADFLLGRVAGFILRGNWS